MDLESIIRSEISQKEKHDHGILTNLFAGRNRDADVENTHMGMGAEEDELED